MSSNYSIYACTDFTYFNASNASRAFLVSSNMPNYDKNFYFSSGYVVGTVAVLAIRLCQSKAFPRNNAAVILAHFNLSASAKSNS